jgi:hypothetical protein
MQENGEEQNITVDVDENRILLVDDTHLSQDVKDVVDQFEKEESNSRRNKSRSN